MSSLDKELVVRCMQNSGLYLYNISYCKEPQYKNETIFFPTCSPNTAVIIYDLESLGKLRSNVSFQKKLKDNRIVYVYGPTGNRVQKYSSEFGNQLATKTFDHMGTILC